MSNRVQMIGHTTVDANLYAGLDREVTIDKSRQTLRVHDGVNLGGTELAKADLLNVAPASSLTDGKMTVAQFDSLAIALVDIAQNQVDITAANSATAAQQVEIDTNTNAIATNTTDIAATVAQVNANIGNIANNDADITGLQAADIVINASINTNIANIAAIEADYLRAVTPSSLGRVLEMDAAGIPKSSGESIADFHDASKLATGTVPSNRIASATQSIEGTIQIATTAEMDAGTDDTVAATPLKVQAKLSPPDINNYGATFHTYRNLYTSPAIYYSTAGFGHLVDVGVGPTGSGLANEWSAMDIIPSEAKFIILDLDGAVGGDTSGALYTLGVGFSRYTYAAVNKTSEWYFRNTTGIPESDPAFAHNIWVPLDALNRFTVRKSLTGSAGAASSTLLLRFAGFAV